MRCCAATRLVTKPASRSTLRCLETVGCADGERVDERADAVLVDPQPVEDAPSGRVGEDGERLHGHEHAPSAHMRVKA